MLKQSSSMKKGLAVLLVVLFVASLTGVAASAKDGSHRSGHGHYGGHGSYGGYGYGGGYGSYTGCGWVNGAWVCPAYGYPYI